MDTLWKSVEMLAFNQSRELQIENVGRVNLKILSRYFVGIIKGENRRRKDSK